MNINFSLVEQIGAGIHDRFRISDVRHPLIKALVRLGVPKGAIARAMGVPRSAIWQQKQYAGFLDDETEWNLLNILVVAYRLGIVELEHLRSTPDVLNLHPARKVVDKHEIKDLEANLAYADEVIREMLGLVCRDYRKGARYGGRPDAWVKR